MRTSLAGLALESATSSGLGRAPALQCRTPSRHHLELQDRRDYTPADRAARTCWEKEKITRVPRERETRTHLKEEKEGELKRRERKRRKKRRKESEREEETEKEKKRVGERERSPPCMEKRVESGDWSGKTMNAGGVENRID
ncbi:hypothetical protein TNCV_1394661 [Trichonephila clavipes]|nr:hypothetical protein TNCV_1394661 [Trichonephila clavipes]